VNIPDQGQEVVVFVAQDGLVTIFKEMPATAMAPVKILSVPSEKLSHDGGDPPLAAFEKEMDVIVHNRPGVNSTFPLDHMLAKPFNEQGFILVILEDSGFINPPNHNVMQSSGDIQAGLTRHRVILLALLKAVKRFAT
jgi:hypothetical protein